MPSELPTEQLIAWNMISKLGDHLPFHRQTDIFRRHEIDSDRGTLDNWMGRAYFYLRPAIQQMWAHSAR